jgi:hypothetical protein
MRLPTGILMFFVIILLSILIGLSISKFKSSNKELEKNKSEVSIQKLDVIVPTGTYILKVDTMEFLINNWKSTSVIQIK